MTREQTIAFLRNLLTENDNETYDFLRVVAVLGTLAFIVYSGIALLILGQPWNPQEYGIGFGAVLAAAGGAIRMKDGPAEPPK